MRINKFLALYLPTSRRKADELIANSKVFVNNLPASHGMEITNLDKVTIDGKKILPLTKYEYYAFYKPKGYICSHLQQGKAPTIYEIIEFKYLKYGGRLDKDSEGLLLLSNDGDWLNKIFSSKNKIEKKYVISVKDKIDRSKKLRLKINDKGEHLKINKLKILNDYKYEATLTSGKNHEIRRIFEFNNIKIKTLKRVQIGNYKLGKLSKGELSIINPNE
ncbi:MAG: pseudouridine synthase [Actinomycetota bacterium]|nr:pseudouridine synthase [Actinomycetota bacterium]MDA3013027.1 pseudouridine synthase [Actinomycetota bacterium]